MGEKRAVVVGATGQIGRAAVDALVGDGWAVSAVHRGVTEAPHSWAERGVHECRADRASADFDVLLAQGADLVVDCIAFNAADGQRLLGHAGDMGALVVISSASVYADAEGRTLDEATGIEDFPAFHGPVAEGAATIDPGSGSYSANKRAMEERLLGDGRLPVTVLRPCAIHGPGSSSPRELWPLVRARAGRPFVPLAFDGESTFHTTSATNLAELIRVVAADPARRIVNHGDPEPLPVREIVPLVAATIGHRFEVVPFAGPSPGDGVGESPWAVPLPFAVDMSAAAGIGYRPVTGYPAALVDTCRWLGEALDAAPTWEEAFPKMARLYGPHFADFLAEDAWLAAHR